MENISKSERNVKQFIEYLENIPGIGVISDTGIIENQECLFNVVMYIHRGTQGWRVIEFFTKLSQKYDQYSLKFYPVYQEKMLQFKFEWRNIDLEELQNIIDEELKIVTSQTRKFD